MSDLNQAEPAGEAVRGLKPNDVRIELLNYISHLDVSDSGSVAQWVLDLLPHCNTKEELEAAILARVRMK